MKIKLNSKYEKHDRLVKRLSEELPELIISSDERSWGKDKPSFKHKKKLYEFDTIDEFMSQAKKVLKLTDKDFIKKTKVKIKEVEPSEMGAIRKVEELLLEIPVEKYNLNDLNIKLRLGTYAEKSSSYESDEQTLHYEVEEVLDENEIEDLEEMEENLDAPELSMTSINNDIILDIPSERFSLNDLNLSIKFTKYGEASSTYEVNEKEKKTSGETDSRSSEKETAEEEADKSKKSKKQDKETGKPEKDEEPIDMSKEVGAEKTSD